MKAQANPTKNPLWRQAGGVKLAVVCIWVFNIAVVLGISVLCRRRRAWRSWRTTHQPRKSTLLLNSQQLCVAFTVWRWQRTG
jgi:hypothetical protein